jgi:hypothetical protein
MVNDLEKAVLPGALDFLRKNATIKKKNERGSHSTYEEA